MPRPCPASVPPRSTGRHRCCIRFITHNAPPEGCQSTARGCGCSSEYLGLAARWSSGVVASVLNCSDLPVGRGETAGDARIGRAVECHVELLVRPHPQRAARVGGTDALVRIQQHRRSANGAVDEAKTRQGELEAILRRLDSIEA